MNWLGQVTGHGRITLEALDWLALEYLAFNMREIDKQEIYGNLPTDNPLEFAAMVFQATGKNGCGWVARLDGRPAGAMGVFEQWPGCWQIWSFGTDSYRRVLVAFLPKFRAMLQYVEDHGGWRVECKSHCAHNESHGMLRVVGFGREAVLKRYGRDKQDYFMFAKMVGE